MSFGSVLHWLFGDPLNHLLPLVVIVAAIGGLIHALRFGHRGEECGHPTLRGGHCRHHVVRAMRCAAGHYRHWAVALEVAAVLAIILAMWMLTTEPLPHA